MNELDVLKRFREDVAEPSTDAWLRARTAIEAARAETSAPQTHAAPFRGHAPRHRRRLAILGLRIAVVVAAVGVTLALAKHGPDLSIRTAVRPPAAVIRARVVDALSGEKNTVFHTQSSTETPGQPAENAEEWDYPWNGRPGQIVRQAGVILAGDNFETKWSLTFTVPTTSSGTESSGLACNVTAQRIDVDFTARTWQSSKQSCVALTPGSETAEFMDPKTHQLTSNLSTIVADGLLHVVGYPTVDGQPTVELKSGTQGASTLDLWVDASTYLPVQSVATGPVGDPNSGKTWTVVNQYSFLGPTQSNLANLQVTIPPGFRETVSSSGG
jgi:hypothetical protein